jgi:sulfite exporter TauE/SafE
MGAVTLATLGTALAAGFTIGFGHCTAMCGPLVGSLALAAGPAGTARSLGGQLAYHAGRLTTYALLGAVMGATGAFVNVAGRLAGLSDAVAIAAGVLLVLVGVSTAGLSAGLRRLEARLSGGLRRLVHALVDGAAEAGGPGRLYPVGLVLGVLPCGASWTAFLASAGTGSPAGGLLQALAFGAGTVPALLLVGAAASVVGARLRGALHRAGGVLVTAMGLLFLLRGLGLLHG